MKEFKGTKGSWTVNKTFRSPKINTDISKDYVCEINQIWTSRMEEDGSESSVGQSHNEMMATAKLIAAAPELLEALQEVRKEMTAIIPEKYFEMVDKAINKAL